MIIDDETKVVSVYKRHFVVSISHFAQSTEGDLRTTITSLDRMR